MWPIQEAVINIENAYNQKELKSIEAELSFDDSWDKKSGFKTKTDSCRSDLQQQSTHGCYPNSQQKNR